MKKVGILTLTGENNYGNKLQNYAMEQILMEAGFAVETIRVKGRADNSRPYRQMAMRTYLQHCLNPLLGQERKRRVERKYRFLRFNQHLHQAGFALGPEMPAAQIRDRLRRYDFLVYGSDQIWNPQFSSFSDIYLGTYGTTQQNVAVSASFGIESLDDRYIDMFRKGLANFRTVSVREEAGKQIVLSLSAAKTPEVLVDPTLMLDRKRWGRVASNEKISGKHIAKYFLGHPHDSEFCYVDDIAAAYDAYTMDIGPGSCLGPSDFLNIIRHSECVCTDSFHAVVFSFIFGKDVYVFNRTDKYAPMNSRMQTLFEKLGLKGILKNGAVFISSDEMNSEIARNCIEKERKRFAKFVADNLK